MAMAIKKMENPKTIISEILEDTPSRADIFIW